jgi:glycosyltransferase involved in cell wall biosynthesis
MVSPFPPTRSGIADYSAELLPALREHVDVKPYTPKQAERALGAGHDVLLFQVGNDPLHAPSLEALRRRAVPSVLVLHDFSLHHLFAAAYLDHGREEEYAAELARAHGERGRLLAQRSLAGPKIPVWDLDAWSYPMSAGVVSDADAVLVHSRLVRGAVLRERPRTRVVEIPHHVVPAPRTERAEARRRLGLPEGRAVVVSLGVVTPAKRVGKVLDALAAIPASERPYLYVGGAVGPEDELHRQARDLDLESDVAFAGYLPEETFWMAASAADFAVNLRHPTVGETSGAVCRLAGFGLPILVSDAGWFRELPDAFATKVPVGAGEVELLASEMRLLSQEPEVARARADAGRRWGEERRPAQVAARYAEVLSEVAAGLAAPRAIVSCVASQLHALGVGRPGPFGAGDRSVDARLVAAVAARAAGLLPDPLEETA